MTPQERRIAEEIVAHQLDLLRLGAGTQRDALALLDRLGGELEGELRRADLTRFTRDRLNRLLRQAADAVDRYYAEIQRMGEEAAGAAARAQPRAAAQAVEGHLAITVDATLPTDAFLKRLLSTALIEGARSADWWRRQAKDTAFRFATAVRQGLARGESNEQIVRRVVGTRSTPGVLTASKAGARALVHASVQQVANESRLETFRRNRDVIKGVRQLSTLDGHTTPVCVAYAGQTWDLDGRPIGRTRLPFNGGPPRHWGCRSVLVPITKTFRELGLAAPEGLPGGRASDVGPVPANITMAEWLDSRTAAQLDAQLGHGRARLYRGHKITLQQLLDLRGNPLSVAQLEAKYG